VDVQLSDTRDLAAAETLFRSAWTVTGMTPERLTTDDHDAYPRAIRNVFGERVTHRTNRYLNNHLEIIFTQLTKTPVLPPRVRRYHLADFDFAIGDNHAIDQSLNQASPRLERGVG
jgi:transposase-like protein